LIDQYTEAKIHVAVEAAGYTPRAIRQALAARVKYVEDGHLIDEPAAKLADDGIGWSLQ
jgi:hypothetical protein